jgi:hypothetical protein
MSRRGKNNINRFVDVVKGRAEPICVPEQGVDMIKILSAIYESAEMSDRGRRYRPDNANGFISPIRHMAKPLPAHSMQAAAFFVTPDRISFAWALPATCRDKGIALD